MKKILFTDLDGTLLKKDKTVSEKNRSAIQKMLEAGNCVAVATGRPVATGYPVMERLGLTFPGCYMVAFNGAVVYDCAGKQVLFERTVSMECVRYLFAEAEKYRLHIHTYTERFLLSQTRDRELEFYMAENGSVCQLAEDVPAALKREPCKVLLISLDDPGKLERFQREHEAWAEGRLGSIFSCREYLEYCPADIDKGSGIRFLCGHLGIDRENTYAVGDERNDVPMIKAAAVGIAVRNAHEEAKRVADYITRGDNEQDAIAEIIEHFGLA